EVLDGGGGTGGGVGGRGPPRMGEAHLGEGVAPVLPQEILVETGGDVVPRKDFVVGAMAVDVPVDRKTVLLHRVLPACEVELLGPLLERPAAAPHSLDHRAEPAITA